MRKVFSYAVQFIVSPGRAAQRIAADPAGLAFVVVSMIPTGIIMAVFIR